MPHTRIRPLSPYHAIEFHPLYFYLHFSQSPQSTNAYGGGGHRRTISAHYPTPTPSPTPSPPVYDSPSLSPLDSHAPSWTASSSDTPSLGYSPDIAHSQPFDTVLTPAQGMEATMITGMNFTSRYSAPSRTLFLPLPQRSFAD